MNKRSRSINRLRTVKEIRNRIGKIFNVIQKSESTEYMKTVKIAIDCEYSK